MPLANPISTSETCNMNIRFSKMHGLGNDFMIINAIDRPLHPHAELIRQWSDRRTGIGFDQLLLVEPTDRDDADFRYRIYNADGGEVEQCGNGARCFARFVSDQGLTDRTSIPVHAGNDIIVLNIRDDGQVQIDMGTPRFAPESLPFNAQQQERYILTLADRAIEVGAVSVGNPHAVMLVEDIRLAPVAALGPQIASHELFPRGVNAGFMQIIDSGHIRLRVHERGAGETTACGTGACAAVAVGRHWQMLDEHVEVSLAGGELDIVWPGEGSPVLMTGPTAHVFDGVITL